VGRIDHHVVGELQDLLFERPLQVVGEAPGERRAEQVGARRGADHERATREQCLGLASGIDEDVCDVLGGVPGGGEHPEPPRAHLDLVAVTEPLVGIAQPCVTARPEANTGRRDQLACTGDEVVVDMSLERPGEPDRLSGREIEVLADVAHRVDHHCHPRVVLDHDVGSVAELGAAKRADIYSHGDLLFI
jgi:hypothetical protein